MSPLAQAVVIAVVLARFAVPLAIPRRPVPALVAALVLDAVDQTVFTLVDAHFRGYQGYDKALDVYYLSIAYASTLRNWPAGLAVTVARFLWYYRLLGVAAFELTGARALLLLFPNTFEYFFLAYELVRTGWNPRRLSGRTVLLLAGGIWVFVKLPQEWWIHVARLDVTEQLAAHPGLVPYLLLALVVAGAAFLRWLSRRPPRDWPWTTRVDAHLPHVEDVGPARVVPLRSRAFAGQVAEKTLLVSLVVIVFAQVLPGTRATPTQIVLSTLTYILANAVITQALARRGTTWQSTVSQFAAMSLVNAGIAVVLRLLRGSSGATFGVAGALFLGLLLTLLVTLYDRYRTVRHERVQRLQLGCA